MKNVHKLTFMLTKFGQLFSRIGLKCDITVLVSRLCRMAGRDASVSSEN